jgi:hypothetical protein
MGFNRVGVDGVGFRLGLMGLGQGGMGVRV